ncbi:patatin-like phospholipase family protein [Catalinimonas sp. 4WD22]|uniref:patatin-like phospholipase family protein n=1 Tax=Catalinimonas locisalis TaxID=3133978 RepID=UPI003101593B
MHSLTIIFAFSCLVFSHLPLSAQQTGENYPKVGLVLSGGGAKGMAHVGALKVLEDVGIVPDYITGTSMGSLVGALYAMGYTAEEMEELLINMSWDQVLSDNIPLREVTIEEKPYYGRYLVELPVNGLKVSLPRGVLEGQRLSELFSKLTLGAHDIEDFSQLPIPYAAVAVNIADGKPVILNQGSLPEAMRASMAIPSIFTPVATDSITLLVDGGLARNFPVQEVIDMGADVVIGVDVSGGFVDVDGIQTLVDVMLQSSFMMSNLDTEEQIKKVDLLIQPDLGLYGAGSFYNSQEIIELGYTAALIQKDNLSKLADSIYALRSRPAIPQRPAVEDSFRVQRITVAGNDNIPSSYIKGKLNVLSGRYIQIDEIEKNIELLYGTRFFNKITYELRANGEELLIKVEEAPSAYLRPALHFDTENGAGFILSYVHRNVFLPSSRLTVEADFAENPRVFFNYFKYLGRKQRFAAILGVDYILNDLRAGFGESSNRANSVFRSSWLNPYLRIQTSRFQDWMLGVNAGLETASLRPTVTNNLVGAGFELDLERVRRFPYDSYHFGVYAELNTLDKPIFPENGWHVNANLDYITGVKMRVDYFSEPTFEEELINDAFQFFENTTRGIIEIQNYTPLGSRWNLQSELTALYSSADILSPYDVYQAGGFYPIFRRSFSFWGAQPYEISVSNTLMIRESARFEILPDFYAESVVNLIIPEIDTLDTRSIAEQSVLGYGIGLNYKSILGPIQLSLAHRANSRRWYGFFSLGFNIR